MEQYHNNTLNDLCMYNTKIIINVYLLIIRHAHTRSIIIIVANFFKIKVSKVYSTTQNTIIPKTEVQSTDFLAMASTPNFLMSLLSGIDTVELSSPSTEAFTIMNSASEDSPWSGWTMEV